MNKVLTIFLILTCFVAIVHSDDIQIMVGNSSDSFIALSYEFTPKIAYAKVGDNVCISIFYCLFLMI